MPIILYFSSFVNLFVQKTRNNHIFFWYIAVNPALSTNIAINNMIVYNPIYQIWFLSTHQKAVSMRNTFQYQLSSYEKYVLCARCTKRGEKTDAKFYSEFFILVYPYFTFCDIIYIQDKKLCS